MPEEYGATVVSNYTETPSVYVVQMKLSRPMQFMAGQWIYVYTTNNGKEVKKPYSIASPPSFMKESMLELCVKRVENGFMSTFIAGMKEGTQLKLTGPYGVFSLKENSNEKIFIATGSGIAPFHSMIPELFDKGFAGDVWLFFGVRKQEDIIYRKFFDELAGAVVICGYIGMGAFGEFGECFFWDFAMVPAEGMATLIEDCCALVFSHFRALVLSHFRLPAFFNSIPASLFFFKSR